MIFFFLDFHKRCLKLSAKGSKNNQKKIFSNFRDIYKKHGFLVLKKQSVRPSVHPCGYKKIEIARIFFLDKSGFFPFYDFLATFLGGKWRKKIIDNLSRYPILNFGKKSKIFQIVLSEKCCIFLIFFVKDALKSLIRNGQTFTK